MRVPRILIVDDDLFFRDLFHEALAQPGREVVTAADAPGAEVELARGVDVLVTDLVMPGDSGIELVRRARAARPGIECIVVTQRDEVRSAVEAMRAGAAEYLVKPVDAAALQLAVTRALDRVALRRENLELSRNQDLLRRCLSLLASLDGERVNEQTMLALTQVCDAQSAALWTADDRGQLVLRGFRGLVDREELRSRIDPADDPERYASGTPFNAPGMQTGAAFYLPLITAGDVQGLALLADPMSGAFRDDEVRTARAIADFAATAIRNARRFSQVERVGLRDRDTAVYNLSFFVDYASKEIYKARRYGRAFSLVTLTLDNLEALGRSISHEDLTRLTRGLLGGVSRVTRDADVVAKVADNEFYILLPETDHFGAWMFRRRAREAALGDRAVREIEARNPISLSIGLASYPRDGLDFDELLHHCRARADEDRRSLLRRLQLGGLDFWASVDALLGDGAPSLPVDETLPGASRRGPFPRELVLAMQAEGGRALVRDETARGVLYVSPGPEGIHGDLPVLAALGEAEPGGRLYLLGRRGETEVPPGVATSVYLDADERMARHDLVLMQGDGAAYAMLRRSNGAGFHTSDVPLVDHLVAALQKQYDLQPF